MQLFSEGDLRLVLEGQRAKLRQEIQSEQQDYLLNANETQLVAHFADKFRIAPIVLDEENIQMTDREDTVPVRERDGLRSGRSPGSPQRKHIVTFHIPFSGEADLFKYNPSSGLIWMTRSDASLTTSEVRFDVVVWGTDPAEVTREWQTFLDALRTKVGDSTREINAYYNDCLERDVTQLIQTRKAEILRQRNLVAALGVPIKRASSVPTTFAVPAPKKKVIVAKPPASTASFVPEPTLDEGTYNDILNIIHHTGIEIERHPSIYQGKGEEMLRDYFLMVLSPQFDSVTGETFNKEGKTDILIRHEGKNLFVAECGIWHGAKQFHEKIDQLLSYLTWRDSKTALISFVRNIDFSSVLETIKIEAPKHPSFVKDRGAVSEAWLRYEFSLKDDPSRMVRLAVLCFHFP